MKKLIFILAFSLPLGAQTLRSLAGTNYPGFAIGCGDTDPSIFNSDSTFSSLVAAQCNSIEPGNVMKQNAMEPSNGSYDFSQADLVMNYAVSHTQSVTATAPVWDNATYGGGTPSWVSGLSSGALTTSLQNYVTQFMNHMHSTYPGVMKQIALVSEASHQCPNGSYSPPYGTGPYCSILGPDTASHSYAQNVSGLTYFPEYVTVAYTAARAADPTAHLCYDDWGWEGSGTSGYQYWLVAYLKSRGLVDCVGLEGQWQYQVIPTNVPSTSAISSTISAYQALGVTVYFSQVELGINTNGTTNSVPNSYVSTVPADLTTQASTYSALLGACLANASECNALYVWGISDKWAFIDAPSFHVGAPQPYDASYNPKAAYTALQTALGTGGGCTATSTAATLSPTDVLTALNAVSCPTSTVNLPSGTSAWSTGITYTVPSGVTNLTVKGNTSVVCTGTAGTSGYSCSATDNTIIQDVYQTNLPLIKLILGGSSTYFTMTGLTVEGGSIGGSYTKYDGIVQVAGGNAQNVRIYGNHFNANTYSPANYPVMVRILSPVAGVMDHNLMDLGPDTQYSFGLSMFGAYNDTNGNGDTTWNNPTPWGQFPGAFYLESNYITGGVSNDCGNAGFMTIRYNYLNDNTTAVQTHGTKSPAGSERGCRGIEVYHNYITHPTGSPGDGAVGSKAGPAMVWGNTMPQGFYRFFTPSTDRSGGDSAPETNTPNGWGYCSSTTTNPGTGLPNGTGSNWDGNQPNLAGGYPCLDNLGRGQTTQALNGQAFPSRLNSVTGTIAWPHQYLEPIYLFDNTVSPQSGVLVAIRDITSQPNRDVYADCNGQSQTYSGGSATCSSFTGAAGTGTGVLASRPSTCTPGAGGTYATSPTGSYGTAYFATDVNSGQGELYVCTATNTWTAVYQPAVYPHPLVSNTPQVATPTFSPSSGTPPQTVTTSDGTSGATLCGRNDGGIPTATTAGTCDSSPTYQITGTQSVTVNPTTLTAIGTKVGYLNSIMATATYTGSTPVCGDPTQNGPYYSGTYNVPPTTLPLAIGFTSPTSGCVMHYTTDGSDPTCSSATYPGSDFSLASAGTYVRRTIACQAGYTSSNIATCAACGGTWTINAGILLTVSSAGTGSGTITNTLNCPTGSSSPTSGSTVTCNAAGIGGSTVSSSGTGDASGCTGSSCSITITSNSSLTYTFTAAASTPTFSPVAGTYPGTQSVTTSTATGPCSAYIYTGLTNPPTTLTNSISVASSETVYSYVHNCPSYNDSSVGSAAYVITAPAAAPSISGTVTFSGGVTFQ